MFLGEKENASPIPGRHLHPTYHQKPKPALQLLSQHATLDTKGRSSTAQVTPGDPESIPAVPTTWDTVYDPDHPDADWTGLVQKVPHKKHVHDHVALQESIERNEYGIISKEERQEWARKRVVADVGASKNSGSLVIAGIDEPNERYKTTYRRFEAHERTSRDQLTLEKRQQPVKKVDPAFATGNMQYGMSPRMDTSNFNSSFTSSANTRKDPIINPRSSLLSGIGEKLLATNAVPPPKENYKQPRPNENYRVLTTDNFNAMPGTIL